jgi:hypothetical protein
MRSKDEIERVADRLGQVSADGDGKTPLLDWRGDTFRYGFLVGKLVALGWVLGEPNADLAIDHDYDSWLRELGDIKPGDLTDRLRGETNPND